MRYLLLLTLLPGCFDGTLPPSQSPNDPSNPGAAEVPSVVPVSAAATVPAPVPAAGAEGAVYTCPMHPEVVRDAPGSCPKCGMALVPRAKSPAVDGGSR